MRLITSSLLIGLTLAQLPGCGGTNCAGDGDCVATDTASDSQSDSHVTHTSGSTTDEPTGTTGDPGTGTSSTSTGEPGTTTLTTGEPGTSSSSTTDDPGTGTSTGEPGTTSGGTTGGVDGEPSKMEPACAPDDGPATEFKIGLAERMCSSDFPEDAPIFRIVVFTGPPPLANGDYKLDGGNGFAYLDDGNGVVTGMKGTLTITDQLADGVQGTYDVTLDDNTNLAGEFDAIFCDADILCG